MAGKKTGKRLLTWVLVLVMALSLLPLNVLAANRLETDSSSGMNFDKRADSNGDGTYTITMTAQATGKEVETTEAVPMDIVLVLDQSGSMKERFDSGTRQSAMKEAVISFINEVADKNADHHMAIVTFSDDAKTLAGWTAVDSDGADALTSKIGSLKDNPSGATNVEAGMTETQSLMSNAPTGQNRQKTVIVFTDGVPTTASDFSTTVANAAIDAAKSMKNSGVTIYTVGIFNGAKPEQLHGDKWDYALLYKDVPCNGNPGSYWGGSWAADLFGGNDFASIDVPAGNRFLNYLSSNFKNATAIGVKRGEYNPSGWTDLSSGTGYEITQNFTRDSSDYYLTASDASSLKNIFKVLSNMVPEPVNDKLDKNTVITDTLSDYFTFALTEDGKVDVKVYAEKGNEKTDITDKVTVNPNPQTKTVTVTDYDFSKHYQGIGSDDEETLVIEIKVKPDTSYTNWGESGKYKTNEGNATVTLPNNDTPIAEAESPKAHVNTYKVTYQPGEGSGDEYTDQYYPNGATTKVKANEEFTAPYGYEFDCWKDGNDTTYQVGKDITFDKSDVTLTAQWKLIEAAEPTPATVTLRETDANGNALINKHLTITAKEAETIQNAYFCVAVTAADDATEAVFTAEPRYATTTTVKDMTRTNDGTAVEGSFVFPEQSVLTFTEEGTYTFTVREVFDEYIKVNHTTYDDTEYTMTVNVTKDATENKLNAAVSFTKGEEDPTGSITFYNTYKTPVYDFNLTDLGITVYKKFVSKYGRSAERSFTATATIEKQETYIIVNPGIDNNVTNNRSAVTAEPTYKEVGKATGTVTLLRTDKTEAFKFDKTFQLEPGDYRITVKETNGGDRYVTYDTKPYTRYFKVSEDGVISAIESITITNEYTKRHTAATPSKPTLNTGDHYAYVMGYPDGTVRPNGSITRAEVSAILFRLLSDKTRDEYFTTESSFTDVKAGAWYNNSIATLEKAGVIVDTAKGGAFRPNEAITRAELAAMLAQFSDAKPVKGVKFSDVSAEHWAYEAIAIAAKMGWIEGYPDGTFRPDATITRAEMMTLVNRALDRVPSDEDHLLSKRVMLTFPDCKSGDWFYIAVQEATNSHTYERAATEKNGDEQWTALRANRDWTLLEK